MTAPLQTPIEPIRDIANMFEFSGAHRGQGRFVELFRKSKTTKTATTGGQGAADAPPQALLTTLGLVFSVWGFLVSFLGESNCARERQLDFLRLRAHAKRIQATGAHVEARGACQRPGAMF
jgi:hypothetical protein